MLTITIQGTAAECLHDIHEILKHSSSAPQTAPVATKSEVLDGEITPPAKRETRKVTPKPAVTIENDPPAAAEPAKADEEHAVEQTTVAADTDSYDIEDIRGALQCLAAIRGTDQVFELLTKVGAKSASTVPAEKYGELVISVANSIALFTTEGDVTAAHRAALEKEAKTEKIAALILPLVA